MNHFKIKWLPCLLGTVALFSAAGCGSLQSGSGQFYPVEEDDVRRTQLYVYNSASSYDIAWLTSIKEQFEAAHEQDTHWEQGKQGVQVVLLHSAGEFALSASDIQEQREEVYFAQNADYHALQRAGALLEITNLADPSKQDGVLVNRLTDSQKAYYAADGGNGYFALPDHSGSVGLVYNVDLFEKKGYYFAKTPKDESLFVSEKNSEKSYGADGLPETYDDGLPTTYEEFFALCAYIHGRGDIPVAWGGDKYEEYLTLFVGALAADYEGYEQAALNYTLSGTAKHLGRIKDGGFALDGQEKKITPENAYELARSAGNYYALDFIKRLMDKDSEYYCDGAFKTGYTQAEAREAFLSEAIEDEGRTAMLLDGTWWESCIAQIPQPLTQDEPLNGARRMAWMPLPKANEEKVGEERVIVDCLRSIAFIKSNVDEWKVPLAEAFLQFAYSDEALAEYTAMTGMEKAMQPASPLPKQEKSCFAQSYDTVAGGARKLSPYSAQTAFLENERFFAPMEIWRAKFSIAANAQHPAEAFWKKNASVVDYFNALNKHRKDNWPSGD